MINSTLVQQTPNVQQTLNVLWQRNYLNLRAAVNAAKALKRSRIDVAFELFGAALTEEGEFHDYAAGCLGYLSSNPRFNLFLWTYSNEETVFQVRARLFASNLIRIKGVNENKISVNVSRDQRKPYFDVLIDPLSGFDPKEGGWYWVHRLFEVAAEMMETAASGTEIIKGRERFEVMPSTGVFRNSYLNRGL